MSVTRSFLLLFEIRRETQIPAFPMNATNRHRLF